MSSRSTPSFAKMRFMPPLRHVPHGKPSRRFDIDASQVYQWIAQQPDLLEYVFYRAQISHLIRYDYKKQIWKGVDHHEEEAPEAPLPAEP